MKDVHCKIYWPTSDTSSSSGLIIGWNIKSFVAAVACVITDVPFETLEKVLKELARDERLKHLHEYCGGSPIILGEWFQDDTHNVLLTSPKRESRNLWIQMSTGEIQTKFGTNMKVPKLRELQCYGYGYTTRTHIIFYHIPSAYHYFDNGSLPLEYDYGPFTDEKSKNNPTPTHLSDLEITLRQLSSVPLIQMAVKAFLRGGEDFTLHPSSRRKSIPSIQGSSGEIPEIKRKSPKPEDQVEKERKTPLFPFPSLVSSPSSLSLIESPPPSRYKGIVMPPPTPPHSNNKSFDLDVNSYDTYNSRTDSETNRNHEDYDVNNPYVAKDNYETAKRATERLKRWDELTHYERILIMWKDVVDNSNPDRWWKVASSICVLIATAISCLYSMISRPFNNIPFSIYSILLQKTALQFERRFKEISSWCPRWIAMRYAWSNHPKRRAEALSFYNSLWMIAVDIVAGTGMAVVLLCYREETLVHFDWLYLSFSSNIIVAQIEWLMGWPAGLKLNDSLDSFMGQLFLYYNEWWMALIYMAHPYRVPILVIVAFMGILGFSFQVSVACDSLSLLSLHVYWFYSASARVMDYWIRFISAVWHLFRGKKWNTLRKRVDSCEYDIEQLLLGTILFSILCFLFPTIVVYYIYFTSVRLFLLACQGLLQSFLLVLNYFPVFYIFLYLYDREIFPSGIWFDIIGSGPRGHGPHPSTVTYFILMTSPISMKRLFFQYQKIANKFLKEYPPSSVVLSILQGQPI